jgi:ABC-type multidrug transport system permease subunit
MSASLAFIRDTGLLTARSLRAIPRVPERLLDVTIQPIVFILLFLYVFGSAIHVPGISYKDYMFPGIIGQSLAFGVIGAGVATSHDMTEGVIDRSARCRSAGCRSILPLAFLAGTFVPIAGMDAVPRAIAQWDPISALVGTVRGLTEGVHTTGSWQLVHPELAMAAWSLLIIAVCVPLALRRFNRMLAG